MTENESILSFCLSFLSGEREFTVYESRGDTGGETTGMLNGVIMEAVKISHPLSSEEDGTKTLEASRKENVVTKEKNFRCTFEGCDKSFDYRWILERHVNSHFCFKLFKCEYEDCKKAYKSKENLNLHFRNKHLGEKPYQCRFCISRFSHRNGN